MNAYHSSRLPIKPFRPTLHLASRCQSNVCFSGLYRGDRTNTTSHPLAGETANHGNARSGIGKL